MKHIQLSKQEGVCVSHDVVPQLHYPSAGPVAIPMTNDYLFRAFLQRNNKALKGFIGSLLHRKPEEIISVDIKNPIVLGSSIDDKTFILDIRVCLDNHAIINLEMQVVNQHNWVERSISYLCRNFDNLEAGGSYEDIQPVIQVGILNFTLFDEHPEFYATYQLLNVKDYTLYSDKLRLSVLDLTRIDLASEEDKHHQLDYWASLFKATTWEEITMLAEKNEYIAEAADTIYQLSRDEKIRMECEAREDYYRTQIGIQRKLAKLKELEKNEDKMRNNLVEAKGKLEETEGKLEETEGKLEETEGKLEETEGKLEETEGKLEETEGKLEETEGKLEETKSKLEETESKCRTLEAEKEALASKMENLIAWAKGHGYDPESGDGNAL